MTTTEEARSSDVGNGVCPLAEGGGDCASSTIRCTSTSYTNFSPELLPYEDIR